VTLLHLILVNPVVELFPWVMLIGVAVLLIFGILFAAWWMLFDCPSCLVPLLVSSELVPASLSMFVLLRVYLIFSVVISLNWD
jgi:hypothetical protein